MDEPALRKAHTLVMERVFNSNGVEQMWIGVRVLDPIEREMRRRGMRADYWSMEHKLRSDLALGEGMERAHAHLGGEDVEPCS